MTQHIMIDEYKFVKKNSEYEGKLKIWGKEVPVFIEVKDNSSEIESIIKEKVDWINKHKAEIIDVFMAENDHYVDVINEMIDRGKFKSDKKITSEDFMSALYIHNICFNLQGEDTDFMLDLATDPDYLLWHLACMEVASDYSIEFGGMNG